MRPKEEAVVTGLQGMRSAHSHHVESISTLPSRWTGGGRVCQFLLGLIQKPKIEDVRIPFPPPGSQVGLTHPLSHSNCPLGALMGGWDGNKAGDGHGVGSGKIWDGTAAA